MSSNLNAQQQFIQLVFGTLFAPLAPVVAGATYVAQSFGLLPPSSTTTTTTSSSTPSGVVLESDIVNDNSGNLLIVANADTSSTQLKNTKVVALANLGTHVFSAYPLTLGTDVPHDALSNLTDVSLSGPTSGQVLTFGTGGKWQNQPAPSTSPTLAKTATTGVTPSTTSKTTVLTFTPSQIQFLVAEAYDIGDATAVLTQLILEWQDAKSNTAQSLILASGNSIAANVSDTYPSQYIVAASGVAVTLSATLDTASAATFYSTFTSRN